MDDAHDPHIFSTENQGVTMVIKTMAIKKVISAALLFVSATALPLSAVTFNVTPQDDWYEMLNGPGFLQPGDELVFGAGTYDPGNPIISIRYRGTAANPITIRAAEGANVIFSRSASQNTFNLKGAQYLTIKDIEITNGATAIRIGNDGDIPSKFVTLDGLHIHHTGGQGVTANFTGHDYEGMHFLNNHIHDTSAEGEAFYVGCNNNACQFYDGIIENNYIHHLNGPGVSQGDGIEIKLGSYNNIIRNNVIHDTKYPAITAYGVEGQGARNVIEGNVMWDIENHGIQVASDAIIKNNLILSSLYDGIHVQNHQAAIPGNLDILNNTIRSNVGNDYNTSYVSGHAIRINNPAGGVWSGPIEIANNALYPDGPDTFQSRAIGSYQLTPAGVNGGVTSTNNIGSAIGNDLLVDSSGDLATDFVDIVNWNAFPAAGGKLVGAGDASLQPSDDFNATSRSGSNDVGAYVYDAGGNPGWAVVPDFKQLTSTGTPGDFDTDGDVDGADFLAWQRDPIANSLAEWQNNYGPGSVLALSISVPEPTALALVLLGFVLLGLPSLLRIRRRCLS